jgi:preprotein translocase subunit YajC
MSGEIIIIFGIMVLIFVALYFSRPKPREMSAAEKMAYETERGRQLAIQEFRR